MTEHAMPKVEPAFDRLVDVFKTVNNTGFSELSTRVPQVSHKRPTGVSNEAHMSGNAIAFPGSTLHELLLKTSSVTGKQHLPLSKVIYADLLPALIRKLKGIGFDVYDVDTIEINDIFSQWYEMLRRNAEAAGMDVKNGLQYEEGIFMRFAEMWESTLYSERDWVCMTRNLIYDRQVCIANGSGNYPIQLQQLEIWLTGRNLRLNSTDAAAVLLSWVMSRADAEGSFYLSQRDAGNWTAELVGRKLCDENEAKVVGRAVIAKLKRLGIIEEIKAGKSYAESGRKNAVATTFRWVWGNERSETIERGIDQPLEKPMAAESSNAALDVDQQ